MRMDAVVVVIIVAGGATPDVIRNVSEIVLICVLIPVPDLAQLTYILKQL